MEKKFFFVSDFDETQKGLVYRSIGGTAILIFEAIDLRGLGMRLL